jgi:CheY-like chemotaxis protein
MPDLNAFELWRRAVVARGKELPARPSIADGEVHPNSIPVPCPYPDGAGDRREATLNAPDTRPIRLLLVDYQQAVRRGLKMRLALEEDLEVVGEAGDATEAIPLARALRPDVIVMDVEMPEERGVETIQRLRAAAPWSEVVIFTLRDDAATQEQARAVGAAAFVAKHRTEETLLAAIRGVAHGEQG